jgi:hypothetical protein
MKYKLFVFIGFLLFVTRINAQGEDLQNEKHFAANAPVPIEVFGGYKATTFQLIASKQFSFNSKFGFFNVTNFMGDYKDAKQTSEFYSQSVITAEIWKGISITAGLSAVGSSNPSLITVRPTAGLQYLLANREFVIVIVPRFDLTQTYNFETFAVFEYKPMITRKWGIYSRLQALYNYNTKLEFHEVSSVYLRLGLSHKNIQFGLGSNHDFYGPDLYTVDNYGIFIKTDII